MGKLQVLLSKSVKIQEDWREDKYVQVLSAADYDVQIIETLIFEVLNQDSLSSSLMNIECYSGIILTSEQAAQALLNVLHTPDKAWNRGLPVFVVGPATGKFVKDALDVPSSCIIGEDCGNAQALAAVILQHVDYTSNKPLLFPCSEQRLETIPEALSAAGVRYTEVVCYRTCAHPRINDSLGEYIKNYGSPQYVIYFSPTCVKHLYPLLMDMIGSDTSVNVRHCAIGPSTATELGRCGADVGGVARKPTPVDVLAMLEQSMR